MTNCARCVQPIPETSWNGKHVELEDELHVELFGGYGSFIDTSLDGRKAFHFVLCEPCGVDLARFLNADDVIFHHHTNTCCTCPDNTGRKIDSWTECACAICLPIRALPKDEQRRIFEGRTR